jgi:hypothetical protein
MRLERKLRALEEKYSTRQFENRTFWFKLNLDLFAEDADPVERDAMLTSYYNTLQTAKHYHESTGIQPLMVGFPVLYPKCNWNDQRVTVRMIKALKYADEAIGAIREDLGFPEEKSFLADLTPERIKETTGGMEL